MAQTRRQFLQQVGITGGAGVLYSTMSALGLTGVAETPAYAAPSRADLNGRGTKHVVVLGAGIAGLTSAYELLKAGYGITNLVNRGTATADELAPAEFVAGRKRLAAKVRRYRPKTLAFLGVGAYCHAFLVKEARIGPQGKNFEGAEVWVLPNPSGLNANYQLPELVKLFRSLRQSWQPGSTSR